MAIHPLNLSAIPYWLIVQLFRLIPFSALPALAIILSPVASLYRRKIVLDNLKNAFREWDTKQIKQVQKSFYRRFALNLLQSAKTYSLTKKAVENRIPFHLSDGAEKIIRSGAPFLAISGHINCWELGVAGLSYITSEGVVGVFKPLRNKSLNAIVKYYRGRHGMEMVAMKSIARKIIRYRGQGKCFGMIADQTPLNTETAVWTSFFHRNTPFYPGPERLSRKYDLPVLYWRVVRVKNNAYELKVDVLAEKPLEMREGEIVDRFAKMLEADIYRDPACWLWSHRRWKRAKPLNITDS
jgi:KDO2-lipid IV(A) lauroyltransferase